MLRSNCRFFTLLALFIFLMTGCGHYISSLPAPLGTQANLNGPVDMPQISSPKDEESLNLNPIIDTTTNKCPKVVENNTERTSVNFLAFGDSQFGIKTDRDQDYNTLNVKALNEVFESKLAWPKNFHLSGDINEIRGVLIAGDLTDHARLHEFDSFEKHYGLCGGDGKQKGSLKYPVYEGYGNHDYRNYRNFDHKHKVIEQVGERTELRSDIITKTAKNRAHYSWQWDNIHFVNVNVKPSDQMELRFNKRGKIKKYIDPYQALTFLEDDLKENVGLSQKGVVIMMHYPPQNKRLLQSERDDFYEVIKNYNVIAIVAGHSHRSRRSTFHGIDVFEVGGPFYNRKSSGYKGHFALFKITNENLKVQDIQWEVEHDKSTGVKSIKILNDLGWSLNKEINIPLKQVAP